MVPLESTEQVNFILWLEKRGLKFSSIPNSTWTPSIKQKIKNKKEWLRAGLPDLLILIEKNKSSVDRDILIFIEMKRQKGGGVSDSQLSWIKALNSVVDVEAKVCKWAEAAIKYISEYLKK